MMRLKPLPASPQNPLLTLDTLRFFAASAIVVYHFGFYTTGVLQRLLVPTQAFALAVDLFLVLSGFVIAFVYSGRIGSWKKYGQFMRRRVARLAPLHWITLLFFVLIGLLLNVGLFSTEHPEAYDWQCLAPNFLALHAFGICQDLTFNFVSWSISAEMAMYVISPLILALATRSRRLLLASTLLVLIFLTFIAPALPFLPQIPWYEWTYDLGVLRALPSFMLGVALHAYRHILARIPEPRKLLGVAVVLFLLGAVLGWPHEILLGFVYLVAVFGIAADTRGVPYDTVSRIGIGGQLTYSIYMLHPIVITVFVTFIGQKILKLDGDLANLWLLLAAVVVLALSYLSYTYFEMPLRKILSGKRKSATPAH